MAENSPTQASQTPALPMPTDEERFFAALGYFGFLFILSLIAKPKSEFCRFHAKQSMVLFGLFFAGMLLLVAIRFLGSLVMLALFAVYVIAIYRAYRGEIWQIPYLSNIIGKVDLDKMYSAAGVAVSNLSGLKDNVQDAANQAKEAAKKMGDQEEKK